MAADSRSVPGAADRQRPLEQPLDVPERDPGHEMVPQGRGEVPLRLDDGQLRIVHLETRLHAELEALLGHLEEPPRLGYRPGERPDDQGALSNRVDGGPDL